MKITAKEARETKIYFIKKEGKSIPRIIRGRQIGYEFNITKLSIEEDDLYSFVMESAEQGTNPDGAGNKLFIREVEKDVSDNDDDFDFETKFEVRRWNRSGSSLIFVFDTEEEAEDCLFEIIYKYDFLDDDQRNTTFFYTIEEAEENLIRCYCDIFSIDKEVAISIIHHEGVINQLTEARRQKQIEISIANNKRIETLALEYAKIISKIEGETYKQTAKRLSDAIGDKIESKVFHKALSFIRS